MQPTFVLQDLMHSRLAGCRGDGVEGELKQRAGEGPLRSDGDDATPARHIGRTQSRPNGSVRKQQLKKHISGITANSKSKPAIPHVDARFRKHQLQHKWHQPSSRKDRTQYWIAQKVKTVWETRYDRGMEN